MDQFDSNDGGTDVDPNYTTDNPNTLKDELQNSLEKYEDKYELISETVEEKKEELYNMEICVSNLQEELEELYEEQNELKKLIKLKNKSTSTVLGTKDEKLIKEKSSQFMLNFIDNNDPIFSYVEDECVTVEAYLTGDNLFVGVQRGDRSIVWAFLYWDCEDLHEYDPYDDTWEVDDKIVFDDDIDDKIVIHTRKYAFERKITESLEEALDI